MAKAGPFEEIPSGKKEIGGFRRSHVNGIFKFLVSHISLLTSNKSRKLLTVNGFIREP
jgi:hypothetical protein